MTIRIRIILGLCLLLALLGVGIVTIFQVLLLPEIEATERRQCLVDLDRVQQGIDQELERIHLLAHDWGWWDDSYAYAANPNREYEETNLTRTWMEQIQMDLLVIVNADGKLLASVLSQSAQSLADGFIPDNLTAHAEQPLLRDGGVGIAASPLGPLLLAASQILPTSHNGPSRGQLVFGRLVSDGVVNELSRKLHLPVQLGIVPGTAAVPVVRAISEQATRSRKGLPLLNDPSQLLGISLQQERPFYQQTLASARYVLMVIFGVALVAGVCAYLLLERILVRPILALKLESERFSRPQRPKGDYFSHLSGQDEIGQLAQSFADMARQKMEQRSLLEQARADADAASQAKGQFLANMSHEMRTPLGAILGMADRLRRSGVISAQSETLGRLESAGKHLLSVINAVLDVSKIEAGKLDLAEVDVDIDHILGNVAAFLQDQLDAKGIALRIERPDRLPLLSGDAARLQQAILNYAANAVKFTETGAVTIRVRVESQTDATIALRIEVEDTGIGIAPGDLERLFAAFEQADQTNTRAYGGTGLGLAITRQLAQAMGGDAGASSTLGEGSTFWFSLVLKTRSQDAVPEPAAAPSAYQELREQDLTGLRIMVAEDFPFNQEMVQLLLADVGLSADLADDGLQALELARIHRCDLVLMDMQMPKMDGLDAARALRQLPDYAETPIIALTANAFAEYRQLCLDAGMNDFLTKPLDADAFYRTLLQWLPKTKGRG